MPEIRASLSDVCDFCSDPLPIRVYQAPDFMLAKDALPIQSQGGWMACAECARLIDGDEWDALRRRAIEALVKKYYGLLPRREVEKTVIHTHAKFREHMRRDA